MRIKKHKNNFNKFVNLLPDLTKNCHQLLSEKEKYNKKLKNNNGQDYVENKMIINI